MEAIIGKSLVDRNIRMALEEIGVIVRNWLCSAQDCDYWRAILNAVLNLRISIEIVIGRSMDGVMGRNITMGVIMRNWFNSIQNGGY